MDNRAVNAVNQVAASRETNYVSTDFGIRSTNEETRNIISQTFGMIKNSLDSVWASVGLDPNVNNAYEQAMTNPMEIQGRNFYQHPGVGNLRPYNEMGNPAGGCFTLHTLA